MELILLEKIQNLGDLGDKVNVKPGYGRNYLVPQGKAIPATDENIARFEEKREELLQQAHKKLSSAQARQASLAGVSVDFDVNASAEGKLYGSIGPREIAEKLTDMGYPVEKSEVIMGEGSIRHVGRYEANLHLHADVDAVISVTVHSEDAIMSLSDDAEDAETTAADDSEE